ncbi:MAG: DUF2065 domain-containing protein [Alphaproteobacteria bacterium]|nr:DUF2065 domain-containing protein [Alphaproteobacteria bacterium]
MEDFPLGDFLAALGLALVIEGAVWLAAPESMRRFMLRLAGYSPAILRFCGLTAAMLGLAVVWAARRWV